MISKVLYALFILSLFGFNYTSARKYVCNEDTGFCTQQILDFQRLMQRMDSPRLHETQELCRLVCGDSRGLWPLPTGDINLSRDYIPFKTKNVEVNLYHVPDSVKPQAFKFLSIFQKKVKLGSEDESTNRSESTAQNLFITVNVSSTDSTLDANTDEQYEIILVSVNDRVEAWVSSVTVYGARHGLETLLQLTGEIPGKNNERMIISSAYIRDRPVYKHRGLLLDTARNYFPLSHIRLTLDGMAVSKLNVFHWHITDAQSFPLEIEGFPQFTKYGAYSPDKVYTVSDVQSIIRYAKNRGIRVIIEIDAPAHASLGWQWGKQSGLGDLAVCVNKQPWRSYCIQPPCGQLNPVNPNTIQMLKNVYQSIWNSNPGEIIHMGGDEVHLGCWNSTETILEEMQKRGIPRTAKGFLTLWSEFQQAALTALDEVTKNLQTKTILWSSELTDPEHIRNYLPKDRYVIQTWVPKDSNLTRALLELGYELIISTKDAWYLDHGFWGSTTYYSWRTVYANKILADYRVLGGEACMWGEFVGPESLHARIWPRAAAFAERLWTDPITFNPNYVEVRLNAQRKRLLGLGLTPDALKPEWCLINEGECLNYNIYGN